MSQFDEVVNIAEGFTSHSLHCNKNKIFVALKGLKSDGHQYVAQLIDQNKLLVAVVSHEFFAELSDSQKSKCIAVDNTQQAHRQIAAEFRQKSQARFVAIGGSSGKTSTKEFLRQILSPHFKTIVTQGSQNGEQGIPKTLEQLEPDTELALIEVGIDRPGDMQRHMDLLCPDIGILTSVGEEHLAYLKNVETVFEEETLLFKKVWQRQGVCFAPSADSYLSRVNSLGTMLFSPAEPKDLNPQFQCSLEHPLALQNVALAVLVALNLGVKDHDIVSKLNSLKLPDGRGKVLETTYGQRVVADHYNSNPSSLQASFAYLHKLQQNSEDTQDLYLFLGEMRELGEDSKKYHQAAVEQALELQPKLIVLVGEEWAPSVKQLAANCPVLFYKDSTGAFTELQNMQQTQGLFLVKGSRGVQMEELLKIFKFQS